jgi:hypothetical protein
MTSKAYAVSLTTAACLAVLAAAGHAQQQPSKPSESGQAGAAHQAMTIDCPREAAAPAASGTQVVGSPSGSGLSALPSEAQTQRVEGAIKAIDSSRTNRIIEVGDVKLEVEPTTVVLVRCKPATVADLKVGTQIKAAYEDKAPNRHLAKVIEAKN